MLRELDHDHMRDPIPPEAYSLLEPDLRRCRLCAWECDVDRLAGEVGVCGQTVPLVAHSTLHPAPPAAYDAFLTGCNYRCLFCQNWSIAYYPQHPLSVSYPLEGWVDPEDWAERAVEVLHSPAAAAICADRLFFTGGEPTCSLPWVEAVAEAARRKDPSVAINYDTNGFLTQRSLERVCAFASSITYDIKCFSERTFRSLTGAPAEPVLRNVEYLIHRARELIYEFRIMVIPGVHDASELRALFSFLSNLDATVPVCLLAFRPHFILEGWSGPSREYMEHAVALARQCDLEAVHWSGQPGLAVMDGGEGVDPDDALSLPQRWVAAARCVRVTGSSGRICGQCSHRDRCPITQYLPRRSRSGVSVSDPAA